MAQLRSSAVLALLSCVLLTSFRVQAVTQDDIDNCDEFVIEEIMEPVPGVEDFISQSNWEQKLHHKFLLRDEFVLFYDVDSVCANPKENLEFLEMYAAIKGDMKGGNRTDHLMRLYRPLASRFEMTPKAKAKIDNLKQFFGKSIEDESKWPMLIYINADEPTTWATQMMTMPSTMPTEIYTGPKTQEGFNRFIHLRMRDQHFRQQFNMLQHLFEKKSCKEVSLLLVDLSPLDGLATQMLKYAAALAEGWYTNRTVVPIQTAELAYLNSSAPLFRKYHSSTHVYTKAQDQDPPAKLKEGEVQDFPDELLRGASTCTLRDVRDDELLNLVHFGFVDDNRVIFHQEMIGQAGMYTCPEEYRQWVGDDCDRWWASRLLLYAGHPSVLGVTAAASKVQQLSREGVVDIYGVKDIVGMHIRQGPDYKYPRYPWESWVKKVVELKSTYPAIKNVFMATDDLAVMNDKEGLEFLVESALVKPFLITEHLRFGYSEIENCTSVLPLCLRKREYKDEEEERILNFPFEWPMPEYRAPGRLQMEALTDLISLGATRHFIGAGACRFTVVAYLLRHLKFFPGDFMPGPVLMDQEDIASGHIPWGGIPVMEKAYEGLGNVDHDLWNRLSAALFNVPIQSMPVTDDQIPDEYRITFDLAKGIPKIPHEPFYKLVEGRHAGWVKAQQIKAKVQRIKFRFNPATIVDCPVVNRTNSQTEGDEEEVAVLDIKGDAYYKAGWALAKMANYPVAMSCLSRAVIDRRGLDREQLLEAARLLEKARRKVSGFLLKNVKSRGDLMLMHDDKAREQDYKNQVDLKGDIHNTVECPMNALSVYSTTQDVIDVAYALFDEGQYEYALACFYHLNYLIESRARPYVPHEYELVEQNFMAMSTLMNAPGGVDGKLKYLHVTQGIPVGAYDLGVYARDEYVFVKDGDFGDKAGDYLLELFETEVQWQYKRVLPAHGSAVTDVVLTEMNVTSHPDKRLSPIEWEVTKRMMTTLNNFGQEIQPINRFPNPLGDTNYHLARMDERSPAVKWGHFSDKPEKEMMFGFCIFLSDGGNLEFPDLDTIVEPKRGDAVMWPANLEVIQHAKKEGPKYFLHTYLRADEEDLPEFDYQEIFTFVKTGVWTPKTKEELLEIFKDEL